MNILILKVLIVIATLLSIVVASGAYIAQQNARDPYSGLRKRIAAEQLMRQRTP